MAVPLEELVVKRLGGPHATFYWAVLFVELLASHNQVQIHIEKNMFRCRC